MFKLITTAVIILLCSPTVMAENKVVTNPVYTQRNLMRIDKLDISPEATAVYCTFRTFYPENSRGGISSKSYLKGESGKIYKLLRSEGITLDEQLYSYQPLKIILHFEPLEKNEKIVHFVEMSKEKSDYSLSDIYTYKPENVKPFVCTIKGQVIGFDCEFIRLDVSVNFSRLADCELIPVVDGKFEFTKEYNFIEQYNIYPERKNPMKPIGEFSTFYISEGVINIVMNSKESNKGNEISGDIPESFSYSKGSYKTLVQDDTIIYKQYYDLIKEQNELPSEPETGVVFLRNASIIDKINIIAPKDTAEIRKLLDLTNTSKLSVDKDSFRIELAKIEQSPDFYKKEALPVIKAKNEANDRNIERLLNIFSENPTISNFYKLESIIISIRNKFPNVIGFEYWESEGKTSIVFDYVYSSDKEAVSQLNKFLKVYEDKYKHIMQHHPLNVNILNNWFDIYLGDMTRFFEACSKIDLASPIKASSDKAQTTTIKSSKSDEEINSELIQLKDIIAKAIDIKDDKATKIINLFASDFLPKYPNHEITNEIKRMIRIASDDRNPNKWKMKKFVDPESLKAALEFIKKHQDE